MELTCNYKYIRTQYNLYSFFNLCFFGLYVILWAFSEIFTLSLNDNIKYIPIIFIFITNFLRYGKDLFPLNIKKISPYLISVIAISFISVSLYFVRGHYLFALNNIFLYIFPALLFVCAKMEKSNYINKYFYILFLGALIVFLAKYFNLLTFKNILSINFMDSYSPFENEYADIWLFITVFFLFSNKKILFLISLFILYLSFKRPHLIFICLFITLRLYEKIKNRKILDFKKQTRFKITCLMAFFLVVLPFMLKFVLSDNFETIFSSKFGISFEYFSKGRNTLYNKIPSDFVSYGLGTIKEIYLNGLSMHNDILTLYLEIGFIGYFIYIFFFFKMYDKNPITLLVFLFYLFTMSCSHIIDNVQGMFINFLLLCYFSNRENCKVIKNNKILLNY